MNNKLNNLVSIVKDRGLAYPSKGPFNPNFCYKEYLFGKGSLDPQNKVYGGVREGIRLLGLDKENFGKSTWNPFGEFIKPGDNVVVKPNAVLDINQNRHETVFASITHASVLRPVVDYVYIALKGKGKITIADAPLAHSNFDNWLKLTDVNNIVDLYKRQLDFDIQVLDLRKLYVPFDYVFNLAHSNERVTKRRDPLGYTEVNLGDKSEYQSFSKKDVELLYGSDFNRRKTVVNHLKGKHKYLVPKTILDSDVFISVPKLKVHSKVGVTLNLKGTVGTQGDKNYIPHYRIGSPKEGGDEYPDLGFIQNSLNKYRMWLITTLLAKENYWYDQLYKVLYMALFISQCLVDLVGKMTQGDMYMGNIVGGCWYGNDTCWRMSLDLTRIVMYANKKGEMKNTPQRKIFTVIDGIVGGEKEGPLAPSAKKSNLILAGFNFLAVDWIATRLMGFNPFYIFLYQNGVRRQWLWGRSLDDIQVLTTENKFKDVLNSRKRFLSFNPSKGWRGHIEV